MRPLVLEAVYFAEVDLVAYMLPALSLPPFGPIPTLASPQEFFIRAEHSYASARDALGRRDAGSLKAFLMELKP